MSARHFRLSPQALTDLQDIAHYLHEHSPSAAVSVLDALERTFRMLADHPELGEMRDDLHPGIRMLVPDRPAHRYVVFYYIADSAIEISDVIHSARDWISLFARGER